MSARVGKRGDTATRVRRAGSEAVTLLSGLEKGSNHCDGCYLIRADYNAIKLVPAHELEFPPELEYRAVYIASNGERELGGWTGTKLSCNPGSALVGHMVREKGEVTATFER